MPGSGKSFFGQSAAQELHLNFIDLDELISMEQNSEISEIFNSLGENKFRKLETQSLKSVFYKCKTDTIISCGGGTPCFNNNMDWMNKKGKTVWLDCPLEEIEQNINSDLNKRPLFKEKSSNTFKEQLNELYLQRHAFYAQSKVKLNVNKGLSPYLFTKLLHLSTFAENN